jgi:hypothetical protein
MTLGFLPTSWESAKYPEPPRAAGNFTAEHSDLLNCSYRLAELQQDTAVTLNPSFLDKRLLQRMQFAVRLNPPKRSISIFIRELNQNLCDEGFCPQTQQSLNPTRHQKYNIY